MSTVGWLPGERYAEVSEATRWRATIVLVGLISIAIRLPFVFAGIGMDEGGYAYVAQQWASGVRLYSDGAWVDRPQGLLLMYRLILFVNDSPEAIRVAAALVGGGIAVSLVLIGSLLASRRVGVAAGVVYAVIGVAPLAEGFTFNAELAAALPVTLAVLFASLYASTRSLHWIVAAGIAGGCALTVKQSAIDGLVVAVVAAVLTGTPVRRRLIAVALVAVGGAVPIGGALIHGVTLGWTRYWWSIVGYRLGAGSGGGASFQRRWLGLQLLLEHVRPELLIPAGVGIVGIVAVVRWRRFVVIAIPLAWFAAAFAGANVGGLYWPHYVIQVLPPLALLCGAAIAELRRVWILGVGVVVLPVVLGFVSLLSVSASARERSVSYDARSANDALIAAVIDRCVPSGAPIIALPAEADLPFLAGRRESYPYLWSHEIYEIPGAFSALTQAISTRPAMIAVYPTAATMVGWPAISAAAVRAGEHQVGIIGGVRLLSPLRNGHCWRAALGSAG